MFWPFGLPYRQQMEILRRVEATQHLAMELMTMVAHSFAELKQQIEASTTVQRAATELLRELAERLEDIANHPSPEEVRQLAQELRQHSAELANAIAKHATDSCGPEGESGVEPEDPEQHRRR